MQIDILSYGLIGIVVGINIVFLILNIILIMSLVSVFVKLKKQLNGFEEKYGKELDDANKKAMNIISEASKKAEHILKNVEVDTNSIKEEMNVILKDSSEKYSESMNSSIVDINDEYNKFLIGLKDQMKGDTQKMVNSVLNDTREEIEGFTTAMKRGTIEAQENFEKKLHEEFSKALANIDSYRREQLSLIERSINRIIIKVTKDVLSESISITDHEKLIFDSLERAKKEEIFEGIIKMNKK